MRFAAALVLSVLLVLFPVPVPGLQEDAPPVFVWQAASPLGVARHNGCAVAFGGNRILVAGGIGEGEAEEGPRVLQSAEIYLEDRSFQAAPDLLRARSHHSCSLLPDGRILVVGGRDAAGNAVDAAEIYDPVENAWRESENRPLGRWGQSATVLQNGLVLIAGGESGERVHDELEVFNPYTNAFEVLSVKLSSPRRDHGAALLPDGSVLYTGGFDGNVGLASSERYDAASGTLAPGPEMSGGARYAHSSVALADGAVWVAGGTDGLAETATTLLFRNGEWSEGPKLREARSRHAALRIPNNGGVLIAGGVSAGTLLDSSEFYGAEGSLAPAGPLTVARSGLLMAAREDGVVLAAGGLREGRAIAGCGNFLAPTMALNRTRYVRNQTMTVSGQNWPANSPVTLSGVTESGGNLVSSTSPTGTFSFSFPVSRPFSTTGYVAEVRVESSNPANVFTARAPYRVLARTTTILSMNPSAGSIYGNTVTANVEVRPEGINGQMAGVVVLNRLVQLSPPPQPPVPLPLLSIVSVAPQPGSFARNVNEFGFFTHPIVPPVDLYSFQAAYQENDFYAASNSAAVTNYAVGKAPVTLSLSVSPDPPVAGSSSVVTVTANSPSLNSGNAALRPQGFVSFQVTTASGGGSSGFGASLGTGIPPRASSNPVLRAGVQNTITANYQGSANHLAASASIVRTPVKATPVLTVTPIVDIGGVSIPMEASPCRIWIPCRVRVGTQGGERITGTVTMQPPSTVSGSNTTGSVFSTVDFVVQAAPATGVRQFGFNYGGDNDFNPASTIAQVDFVKIPTVLSIKAAGVTLPAQGAVTVAKNVPVTFDIEMIGASAAPAPSGRLTFSDFTGSASTTFRAVSGAANLYRVSFTRVYSVSGPAALTFSFGGDAAFLDRVETRTIQVQ